MQRKFNFGLLMFLFAALFACKRSVYTSTSAIDVQGVSLNKSEISILVDAQEPLSATIDPATAANHQVSWSTSAAAIAAVSVDGVVTGMTAGTAIITATTIDGNKTATCTVTVTAVAVTGVSLNKATTSILVGNTETLVATITPQDATAKGLDWRSNDQTVAAVSDEGVVTAIKAGEAKITVTTKQSGHTATCLVTTSKVEILLKKVELNKTTTSILVGNRETLVPIFTPTNASDKVVTWESNNENVATVSATGEVLAKAAGKATITVKANDGGKMAICTVTVSN